MRALDAFAARARKYGWIAGIERHREDIGAEGQKIGYVGVRSASWDWTGSRLERFAGHALDPAFKDGLCIGIGAGMCDHADAHAVKWRGVAGLCHALDHIEKRSSGPIDADEVAIRVVAIGLAMTRQPAIGAVGAASLGVGQQQIETARAVAAIETARLSRA